jgi:hypothetical protein
MLPAKLVNNLLKIVALSDYQVVFLRRQDLDFCLEDDFTLVFIGACITRVCATLALHGNTFGLSAPLILLEI